MCYVEVAIPCPVHTTFTYVVGENLSVSAGMRAQVPFRNKSVIGLCMETTKKLPSIDPKRIRRIERVLDDTPIMDEGLIKLIKWISNYYLSPIGEVVVSALPSRLLKLNTAKTTRPHEPFEIESIHEDNFGLTPDQLVAVQKIVSSINTNKTFLLHGVTGSGKTEIYFRVFEELIRLNTKALLLVPEIGLTPQLTGRASARFGAKVAVYHSGLTEAQRHRQWERIKNGEIDIVIGTRSALFLPIKQLGAIVVDEEHDASYKQDDGVTYHGRDAAVMRAHIEGITAILGSATPSIESVANVRRGKYELLKLETRPLGGSLPTVEVIDIRRKAEKSKDPEKALLHKSLVSLSPKLYEAISDTLKRNEQVIIYIGRRGFASSIQCDMCGKAFTCPNCEISLVLHEARNDKASLVCHYCGYKIPMPKACPCCYAGELVPIGVGTERLEAEIRDFFPDANIARFDSDAIGSTRERKRVLSGMRSGKIDILVGTQMITKGHDFPSVTLVGVVGADASLNFPDFRAAERTFQLITQVAGRAGRRNQRGRVIIQTRQPEHLSFTSAQNHDSSAFTNEELSTRRELGYPPFSKLANIKLSSTSNETASSFANWVCQLTKAICESTGPSKTSILGPSPAPIAKIRNRYRWQILIKFLDQKCMSDSLLKIRQSIDSDLPSNVRVTIDVDPVNLL